MLKDSLPKFSADMVEMEDMLQAEQIEFDRLEEVLQELVKQFYIKSASYSLDSWESEFGLERNMNLTQEQRRGRILAKMNTKTPASISMLENLVKEVLGANNVTIIEHPAEYSFDIFVNTKYIVANMEIADQVVYDARPAHLGYRFINELVRNSELKLYAGFKVMIVKTMEGEVS